MLVFTQQAMCLHGLSVGTLWKGVRFWAIFLHSLPTVMPRGCTWEGQLEMLVCKCVWLVYVRRIRDRLKHLPPLRVCFVCGLRFVLFYFFRQTSMMFNWSFLSVFTRWPEQICSPNMVRGKGEKKNNHTFKTAWQMYVSRICYCSIIVIINRLHFTGKAGLSAKCLIIKWLRPNKCLTAFLTKRGNDYRPDPSPVKASG